MREGIPQNTDNPENSTIDAQLIADLQNLVTSSDDPDELEARVEELMEPWKQRALPPDNDSKKRVQYQLRLGHIFQRAGMLSLAKTALLATKELGSAADYDLVVEANRALAQITDDQAVARLKEIIGSGHKDAKKRIADVMKAWEKETMPNFLGTTRQEDAKNAIRYAAILLRAGLDQEARIFIKAKIIARKIFPFGSDQKKSTELLTQYLDEMEATQDTRDSLKRLIEEESES